MLKEPRKISLETDQDIIRVVQAVIADGAPRMLERGGEAVAVLLSPEDYAALSHNTEADIWAGYDPRRARKALREGRSVLAGVDREALLRDVRGARGQASGGRPA